MKAIRSHDFEIDAGKVIIKGKSHYPDCLNISIPKSQALRIIEQLARVSQFPDQETIPFSFIGRLDYNIEE